MDLPYLTESVGGIGGRIKDRTEDFQVEELGLYEPCGEGTHVYFRVRKAGIPTAAAVDRIAKYMSVPARQIGVAGLKDAQAVTTQMMSLEHADAEKLAGYRDPRVQVIWTGRHTNKLRPGHLAGNRFGIRIRGVGQADLPAATEILEVLIRRGVPNYFGSQRFGLRGDTAELGELLIKDNLDEFMAVYLGQARQDDPPDCKAARDAFDGGFYNRALDLWPRHYADQRRALSAYKKKCRPGPAIGAIDRRMRKFYVSAFQSWMFNEVLARRVGRIDKVLVGDMAQKTDTGGVFTVADSDVEQPRAERFEISPTGPVFGYRSDLAGGAPGEIEQDVLAAHGLSLADFRRVGGMKLKGTRRPLRFRMDQAEISAGDDEWGQYIELCFTAASGCYATVAIGEITKADTHA